MTGVRIRIFSSPYSARMLEYGLEKFRIRKLSPQSPLEILVGILTEKNKNESEVNQPSQFEKMFGTTQRYVLVFLLKVKIQGIEKMKK